MSKPQGTYIRIRRIERAQHEAAQSRSTVASARSRDLQEFLGALSRISERELDEQYRAMALLVDKLKKGKLLAKKDEDREAVSKAIEQVRAVVEKVKDLRQLEGRLSAPLQPVLRALSPTEGAGFDLALVIALCQVFEVFVRLRRRGRQ